MCHFVGTGIDPSPRPPSWTQWLREELQHLKFEKLRFTIHDSSDNFKRFWRPFMDYIRVKP